MSYTHESKSQTASRGLLYICLCIKSPVYLLCYFPILNIYITFGSCVLAFLLFQVITILLLCMLFILCVCVCTVCVSKGSFSSRLLLNLASAFVVVECIAPDEERLVLLKPVVQFSFTYGVSRGLLYIFLYINQQFIYCDTSNNYEQTYESEFAAFINELNS